MGSGVVKKKKLICFFMGNEKKFNFLSSGPSLPLFSSIKKILLKMFAMLIKNSLYISGVFIKISKMCSKMAHGNNNKKRFKQHIHLNFSLKGHFFECFISFKICYAFEFISQQNFKTKQKKLTMSKKKKKYLIEK